MNEPQPVRRVARFGNAIQVIGLKSARDYILLFVSVLCECPVQDVNHILRGEGDLKETSGTGEATINIIFYLCKINLFLLVFKSFNLAF